MLLIVLKNNFFKLMINSVYGKTMENLRKRINVRLVNKRKDFLKYTSRPTHITHKTFCKNHAAIHEIKPVLTLNETNYELHYKNRKLYLYLGMKLGVNI